MHLNCALVSSILFISAVLAGNHLENQQPPFLDRVEKSINTTDKLPITIWGGAVQLPRWQGEDISFAAATFTLPSAWGPIGSTFNIIVGIGGYKPCKDFTLNIAIAVTVTKEGASYKVWGQGYTGNVIVAPRWFRVSTGDTIRAVVRGLTPSAGLFILINLDTGRGWGEYLSGTVTICSVDAVWIITQPQGYIILPNFYGVTFTDVVTSLSGFRRRPDNPKLVNIIQRNRPVTNAKLIDNGPQEYYVIINYVS